MATTEQSKAAAPKRHRRWVWGVIVVLGVLLGLLLLIPVIASSGPVERYLQAKVGRSSGGTLTFDDLSMGWWAGIRVLGLTFSDAAGSTRVAADRIAVRPAYGSLLSGRISGSAEVERPRVEITAGVQQRASEAEAQPAGGSSMTLGQVDLTVRDGQVSVSAGPSQTVRMADIDLHLRLEPPGKTSQATLKMSIPQGDRTARVDADVSMQRSVDPKAGWLPSGQSGDLQAKALVQDLDLASLKPILALAGLPVETEGQINAQVEGRIEKGQIRDLQATVTGTDVAVTGQALSGDRLATRRLDLQARVVGRQEGLEVQDLRATADWLSVQAKGRVPMDKGRPAMAQAALDGQLDVDVAKVVSQLPKTLRIQESLQVQSGRLSGSVQVGSGLVQADLSLKDVAGVSSGKTVALSQPITAVLKARTEGAQVQIERLDLNSSFAQVQAKGDLERVEHRASIDLAALQSEMDRFVDLKGIRFAGRCSSQGVVRMGAASKAFQGSVEIDQVQLTGPNNVTASEPKARIQYALDLGAKDLKVNSLQLDSGLAAAQVEDAVIPLSLDKDTPLAAFPVNVSKVDLARVRPWLVALGYLDPNMVLAGMVSSPVQVTFDSTAVTLTSDRTRIEGLRWGPQGRPMVDPNIVMATFKVRKDRTTGTLEADLRIQSPAGGTVVDVPSAEVWYRATDQTTSLRGKAQYAYDLAKVTPALAAFLPQDMVLAGKRHKSMEFSAEYPSDQSDQILTHLKAKAGLGFDSAGYMGLDVGKTDPNTVLTNGLLTLLPFTSTVNQGQLNFGCTVDLTKSPVVFTMPQPMQIAKDVQITPQMAQKLLRYVSPLFAGATSASGRVSLACERLIVPASSADLNRVEVIGTVSMEDVLIGGSDLLGQLLLAFGQAGASQRLAIQPTRFVVKDGVVRYDNMEIHIGDHPLNLAGSIGPKERLDMTVTMPYAFQGKIARVGQPSGQRIAVPLTGTLRRPQLDIQRFLESQLLEQGLKGLERLLRR